MNLQALHRRIEQLADSTVLVVGDVILDEYLIGRAARLSREAPIPVLEFMERRLIPGGAANPAANIAALGSRAIQIGIVGADTSADEIRRALETRGIDATGLVTDSARPTIVKTRILAHQGLSFPQQVARLDRIERTPINGGVEEAVLARIASQPAVDAILVSDYLSGLLTHSIVAHLRDFGEQRGVLLTADAQGQLDKYRSFDVVKCNRREASHVTGKTLRTDADIAAAGRQLVERLALKRAMLITRGADGITTIEADGRVAHLRQFAGAQAEVFDTVGAGDTVIAVLTLALIAGAPVTEAAILANVAAGLVVRRISNYTPSPEELHRALETWAENAEQQ